MIGFLMIDDSSFVFVMNNSGYTLMNVALPFFPPRKEKGSAVLRRQRDNMKTKKKHNVAQGHDESST